MSQTEVNEAPRIGPKSGSSQSSFQLKEAEKTIANKDVIISMLRTQMKKLEEMYKNNLDETEKIRLNYILTSEELQKFKIDQKKNKNHNKNDDGNSSEESMKSILDDFSTWKQQCENWLKMDSSSKPDVDVELKLRYIESLIKIQYSTNNIIENGRNKPPENDEKHVCTENCLPNCIKNAQLNEPETKIIVKKKSNQSISSFEGFDKDLRKDIDRILVENTKLRYQVENQLNIFKNELISIIKTKLCECLPEKIVPQPILDENEPLIVKHKNGDGLKTPNTSSTQLDDSKIEEILHKKSSSLNHSELCEKLETKRNSKVRINETREPIVPVRKKCECLDRFKDNINERDMNLQSFYHEIFDMLVQHYNTLNAEFQSKKSQIEYFGELLGKFKKQFKLESFGNTNVEACRNILEEMIEKLENANTIDVQTLCEDACVNNSVEDFKVLNINTVANKVEVKPPRPLTINNNNRVQVCKTHQKFGCKCKNDGSVCCSENSCEKTLFQVQNEKLGALSEASSTFWNICGIKVSDSADSIGEDCFTENVANFEEIKKMHLQELADYLNVLQTELEEIEKNE